jgi:ATP-dependent DNA ligase
MVFDVLAFRGQDLRSEPYRKRREILERLDFHGKAHVPDVFGDGPALFDAVCERAWVKTKNRE